MIPFLTYPLAMLGLAALPALAAIYILRNRHRRRHVSSVMLWRFAVQSKAGGAKIHRLQLPLLFFLELLALLLLVTAATGPRWKLPQASRPLIVVLDDSFRMRAGENGDTAQARARGAVLALLRRQAPPSTRFIVAGRAPRVLGEPARDWKEADKALKQWSCLDSADSLDAAITLAGELGRREANILVLTDHAPAPGLANPRLVWRAFGAALDNAALINASRSAFGNEDRCFFEIANYSKSARGVRLRVQEGTNGLRETTADLGPREVRRLVFNVPATAGMIQAGLDADALAEDNEVTLLPPPRAKVRVQISLTNESWSALAARALDATGLRASVDGDPEIVLRDSGAPAGANTWVMAWTGGGGTNAHTGPFLIDSAHPLARGLALDGAVWAAGTSSNAPGDIAVVLAGNSPLLSSHDDSAGHRIITLNFNPGLSTAQNTPDWPALFWNVLQWRADERPGLREHNFRAGQGVLLKTGGRSVAVVEPGGSRQLFDKPGGDLELDTPLPGLYSVEMGGATNRFSVNLLAADKSDLSGCVTGQWGEWGGDAGGRLEDSPVSWLFGLGALGLLAAHLFVVAGAKGGV